MKLIQGRTLQKIIKQLAAGHPEALSTFTLQRLLEVFRKVCDGVAFAHAKGYLHRDLKPENIMVGEFGEVLYRYKNGAYSPVVRKEMGVWERRFQLSPSGKYIWHGSHFFDTNTMDPLNKLDHTGYTVLEETGGTRWVGDEHIVEIATPQTARSEDDQEILSRVLLLWSKEGGNPVAVSPAPNAVALSATPDGSRLAEAGDDLRVRVRDGRTLEVIREIRAHDAPLTAVAWHPLLPIVATASEDRSVKIWDLRTEKVLQKFGLFLNVPSELYWSPDGKSLAVQHTDTASFIDVFSADNWK